MKKYNYLLLIALALFLFIPTKTLAEEITNIEITGFHEPVIGQKVEFNATVSEEANYTVYLESWMGNDSTMIESKKNPSITNKIETFKENVIYTYSVYIKPKQGYTFADNITTNIDGITLDNYRMAGDTLVYEYEYGKARDIDIKISNVTMPIAGTKPVYTGQVPENANYEIHKELWYDNNGDVVTNEFAAGNEYTYYCIIKLNDNTNIKLPIYATVNENNMEYFSNEGGNLYVFTYKYKIENSQDSFTVIFDANEGTFDENKTSVTVENWQIGDEKNIIKPTREGYEFIGFFTEKTSGTLLEAYIAEAGIDKNMTFYAQWKKIEKNPNTSDNIGKSIFLGIISLIGLFIALISFKKRNKVNF